MWCVCVIGGYSVTNHWAILVEAGGGTKIVIRIKFKTLKMLWFIGMVEAHIC